MVSSQTGESPSQSPAQYKNVLLLPNGKAVKVTVSAVSYSLEQSSPQSMPAGVETTFPPEPLSTTTVTSNITWSSYWSPGPLQSGSSSQSALPSPSLSIQSLHWGPAGGGGGLGSTLKTALISLSASINTLEQIRDSGTEQSPTSHPVQVSNM